MASTTKKIRVSASIDPKMKKIWDSLDNKSAFVRICLENMPTTLTWHYLKEIAPEHYKDPEVDFDNLRKEFNKYHKVNFLNQVKQKKVIKVDGVWREIDSNQRVENW